MSGSKERTLLELNLRRETWCQVDADPRQSWDRTERKHYRDHLRTSPELQAALTAGTPHRAAYGGPQDPVRTQARLPQRRHFTESHKSHLV